MSHFLICIVQYIFFVELVKVKDHPRQAVLFQSDNLGGKTMVLLLRMIMSDFSTGGYVTLDSGLCVLKGLI